jgi:hypothetical protein
LEELAKTKLNNEVASRSSRKRTIEQSEKGRKRRANSVGRKVSRDRSPLVKERDRVVKERIIKTEPLEDSGNGIVSTTTLPLVQSLPPKSSTPQKAIPLY